MIFLDELPWMDTPRSGFIAALEHFWTNFIENAKHRAWSGYAFEEVCLAHIRQIKELLGIAGVLTGVSGGARIAIRVHRSTY